MLVFGRYLLIEGTVDVSCCNDDCDAPAAAVGEDVLTLLPDASSPPPPPPPPPVSPSRCGDDVLDRSCPCFLSKMSAMMSAVVQRAFRDSAVSGCSSSHGGSS